MRLTELANGGTYSVQASQLVAQVQTIEFGGFLKGEGLVRVGRQQPGQLITADNDYDDHDNLVRSVQTAAGRARVTEANHNAFGQTVWEKDADGYVTVKVYDEDQISHENNGLGLLLDAAERLRASNQDIAILILGTGAEREQLREEAARRGLSNVIFVDRVDHDRVIDYWRASDMTLVLLRDSPG